MKWIFIALTLMLPTACMTIRYSPDKKYSAEDLYLVYVKSCVESKMKNRALDQESYNKLLGECSVAGQNFIQKEMKEDL